MGSYNSPVEVGCATYPVTTTDDAPTLVALEGVSVARYSHMILRDINLEIKAGEIVAIVGRSGSGKSTLAHCLAGLLKPTSGSLTTSDQIRVALTFQDSTLLPWLTVEENIRLPGILGGYPVNTDDLLARVKLQDTKRLKPAQLSGGMQHRVAVARALASSPSLLLLDEPYRALDEVTRELLCEDLLRLVSADQLAVLLVTHSLTEAWSVAHRIHVLAGAPATITDTFETVHGDALQEHNVMAEIRQRLRADVSAPR